VADRHFHFCLHFCEGEVLRIGYRKGPGRAGGKLTRSILLNSSTIPKGRRVEVEERESGENVGCSERVVRMWAVERAQDGVVASEKVC
jgi:hypothetical protein